MTIRSKPATKDYRRNYARTFKKAEVAEEARVELTTPCGEKVEQEKEQTK